MLVEGFIDGTGIGKVDDVRTGGLQDLCQSNSLSKFSSHGLSPLKSKP